MMTNAELVLVLGFFSRLQASQDYKGTKKDFEPVMWEGEFSGSKAWRIIFHERNLG